MTISNAVAGLTEKVTPELILEEGKEMKCDHLEGRAFHAGRTARAKAQGWGVGLKVSETGGQLD